MTIELYPHEIKDLLELVEFALEQLHSIPEDRQLCNRADDIITKLRAALAA